MAGTIVVPHQGGWKLLMQRFGLSRGARRRSPFALRPVARPAHAEIFMSERTGDWIHVGCDCRLNGDHWHLGH